MGTDFGERTPERWEQKTPRGKLTGIFHMRNVGIPRGGVDGGGALFVLIGKAAGAWGNFHIYVCGEGRLHGPSTSLPSQLCLPVPLPARSPTAPLGV